MNGSWPALSIRQPWIDQIVRGLKTIEVREWPVERRGPFLIHAARALDWRAVELFGYQEPLALPRGGLIAYAEIADVIPLTPSRWSELLDQHRVLHARRLRQFGVRLVGVKPLDELIPFRGRRRFFAVDESSAPRLREALERIGVPWESGLTTEALQGGPPESPGDEGHNPFAPENSPSRGKE